MIKQAYGYKVPSFAYSIQDWENILEKCPYQEGERKIHMTFLDQVPKINKNQLPRGKPTKYSKETILIISRQASGN